MGKVENVLQCDICHNNFDMNTHRPLVAKCGHTFCKHCILCNHQNTNFSSCPIDNIQYVLNIESCIPNIKLEEVIKIIFNINSPLLDKKIVYSKPEILRNKVKSKTKKINEDSSLQEKIICLDKNKVRISNQQFSNEYKYVNTEPIIFDNKKNNIISSKVSFEGENIQNENINNESLDAIPINDEKSILNVSFNDEMNSLFKKNSDNKISMKTSKNFQSKENLKEGNDINDSLDKISKIDDEFLTVNNTNNDISLLSNKNLVNAFQAKTIINDNENYDNEKLEKYKKYTKNIKLNVLKRNNSFQDNLKKIPSNSNIDTDSNSNGIKEKLETSPNNKLQNIKISLSNNSNENINNIETNYKIIDINNNPKFEENLFKSQQIYKRKEKEFSFENDIERKIYIKNPNITLKNTIYKPHLINSNSTKSGNILTRSYTSKLNFPTINHFNKYSTKTANNKSAFQIEKVDEENNDDETIENNINQNYNINTTPIISKSKFSLLKKTNEEISINSSPQKYPNTPKEIKQNIISFPNMKNNQINQSPIEETREKLLKEALYFFGYNGTQISKKNIEQSIQYQKYKEYINNSLSKKIFEDNISEIKIKINPSNDIFIGYINKNNLPQKGIFYYKNGDYYEGNLLNGIKEGFGILKLKNGTIYEGDFKNNKQDGYGKLTQIDGENFNGEWKEGKIEGKGIRKHNNGDIYIGNYVNNLKEGNGKYIFSNGNVYEGNWENGKANGIGKFIFNDGNIYEGEFKDNIISGNGIFKMKNGDKYIGNFKNGFISGRGVCECFNGDKYSGFFTNGKRNGMGKLVDKNGNVIASGYWNMDKFVGKINNSD